MADLQEIFSRIQTTKKKQKDIRSAYKDALSASGEYQEILDKLKVSRERKKQIEATIKADFQSEFTKLDDYKIDLESDNALLADAALSKMMKGETVEIEDEHGNKYEPVWSVKFKKT